MSVITKAFYDAMVNDEVLVSLLGTYNGEPSVLTQRPLPPGFNIDTHGPYIVTSGESASEGGLRDTKNSNGREIIRDILCYSSLSKSPTVVESIAERVLALFHRKTGLAVAGYAIIVAEAGGPIDTDEEDAYARVVSVRWVLEEN